MSRRAASLAVMVGLLLAIAGWVWGPQGYGAWSILLALSLAWASFVDFDRLVLPDIITLGLVAAGLAMRLADGFGSLLPFVAGGLLGYALLALAAFTYRRIKGRDGLGKGDAKLLAAAGAWLGWAAIPMVLLVASAVALACVVVASLVRRRFDATQRLAFGPFLAAAFWLVWVFGDAIAYEGLFGPAAS